MELKQYQSRVLDELSAFLKNLDKEREERNEILKKTPEEAREDVASSRDFVKRAWKKQRGPYYAKQDGLKNPLPDVYIKVPTGGGKTLLACHAINRIRREYLKRQTGLVVWIVPTNQIYRQTFAQLRDRSHPYRQQLEIASGGRVMIAERADVLSPTDLRDKLVILLLMLPAAAKASKDRLRMYRDSGGYEEFFPKEGDVQEHDELLKTIPNLDVFKDDAGRNLKPTMIQSSLANVFRLSRPLIIVDEGQKAYSQTARETICGFNPAFVLELSATPPKHVNIVSAVSGQDLNKEEMIKLDINLTNRNTTDYKIVLLAAKTKREELEREADIYRQNSDRYIRPIALIQVERVGKDQRKKGIIHAEDAREFLLKEGVLENQIALKTSEKDDLEDIDLLDEECPIRYIITKQALQEGWDCSFAYVLTVLSNLTASMSMTQLVGRVLRQPDAAKTGVPALDECYVFTQRRNSGEVIRNIKKELESEGLSDLTGHITDDTDGKDILPFVTTKFRDKFKKFEGRLYLPQFVVMNGNGQPHLLEYEGDILANLDWTKITFPTELKELNLSNAPNHGKASIGLPHEWVRHSDDDYANGDLTEPDSVLMTRQLVDVIPNAWDAHKMSRRIVDYFTKRDGKEKTANNLVFIIEESKKLLAVQRDAMAEKYFHSQVKKGAFELLLFTGKGEWQIPASIRTRSAARMNRDDGNPLAKTLFDYIPDEDMNEYERTVALYMDEQERLLWWYRNQTHSGYKLQGWKRNRIVPDFITASVSDDGEDEMGEVRVIETKGIHLKNEDTDYKKAVLDLCDELCRSPRGGERRKWKDLKEEFADHQFKFDLVFEDEWESVLNGIFMGPAN
ncbi:MAG: DEAD/DEAH box helicase family protein [Candidatus Dadabacteria bacterium]|nr:DEAD/DEAH box helicase family protein [Candidatus Dadabacteria bacterium]